MFCESGQTSARFFSGGKGARNFSAQISNTFEASQSERLPLFVFDVSGEQGLWQGRAAISLIKLMKLASMRIPHVW